MPMALDRERGHELHKQCARMRIRSAEILETSRRLRLKSYALRNIAGSVAFRLSVGRFCGLTATVLPGTT
jgi:hypothetical protein